jgi:hypothetical protein
MQSGNRYLRYYLIEGAERVRVRDPESTLCWKEIGDLTLSLCRPFASASLPLPGG